MTLKEFVLALNTAQMDICIHLFDSSIQSIIHTATLLDSDDDLEQWLDLHFNEYKKAEVIDICPWLNRDMDSNEKNTSIIQFSLMI